MATSTIKLQIITKVTESVAITKYHCRLSTISGIKRTAYVDSLSSTILVLKFVIKQCIPQIIISIKKKLEQEFQNSEVRL